MDLADLTVVNLRKLAKENGLKGYSRLRKAELIDFLETEIDPKPGIFDLMELPYEMRLYTLSQLRYPDLMRFCATSKAAAQICEDNHFWAIKTRRDFGAEYAYPPWPREDWEEDYRFYLRELEHDLMDAVTRGDVERVRELAEFGVDVNGRDINGTMTPLMRAAAEGSVEIATILLDNGADIFAKTTRNRNSVVKIAAAEGKVEMVRFLLDHGADAQATNRVGSEPIFAAAYTSWSIELVDMLLEAGNDINNTDQFNSSLLLNVSRAPNKGAYIQALIDRGANIDIRSTGFRKRTPLLQATIHIIPENVWVLLENGADITIRDARGNTALDIARRGTYPNPAIREMLEESAR
uniref:F-box domain and ankyrin repeat protein n=1 Tax=Pithovirus LCPAC304 TaxID=2506594 RepID=A0A481ZAF1_9VIRU|nr:MAG: F-box domain and ankyrin repeat protein [Pithovirus LCPAC304]